MAACHSWEAPERRWELRGNVDYDWRSDSDGEEWDYTMVSKREAAGLLFDAIVDAKIGGKISAKLACTLAFFAVRGGVEDSEDLTKLAMAPDKQSGKYSQRFDAVLGRPKDECYQYVKVPINVRNEGARRTQELPTLSAHEALKTHWLKEEDNLRVQFLAKRWPRRYHNHPVRNAAAHGEFVWPLALYLDGVKFSRSDTVLGIWLVCLITGRRWLLMILRKTEYCCCGCRGFCSLHPLWVQLTWGLRALARGAHPIAGPRGEDLSEELQAFAGDPLGFRAAIVMIKGDWMEFAATFCFPTWASIHSPCMLCDTTLALAYQLIGISVLTLPWTRRLLAWYDAACNDCEIRVDLSDTAYAKVRNSLFYDKRKAGARGRALAVDIPELGLKVGDRLEPCDAVPDIGEGFDSGNPGRALFWRIPEHPQVHHRLELFDAELGTGPDSLAVDTLHSGSFGVFKIASEDFLWDCFDANCWGVHEATAEGKLIVNVGRVRSDLFAWYSSEKRHGRAHTEIQALTHHMVGTSANHDLSLHAAELNGFLHFCAGSLLPRFAAVLGARAAMWKTALDAFAAMDTLTKTRPEVFSDAECQRFVEMAVAGLRALQELGCASRPKMHAWVHLATDAFEKGSPAVGATWQDEGLNKMLKDVGSGTSRHGWYERTLFNANRVLDRMAERKAKRARAP